MRFWDGQLAKGIDLARQIAANAPLTSFTVMHTLARIAEAGQAHGVFTEAVMAAVAQSEPEAKRGPTAERR